MNLHAKNRARLRGLWLPAASVILAVLLFLLCYRFDNKYTTATPQPRGGILLLGEETLKEHPVLFLVNGWEQYSGLLTPRELGESSLRSGRSVYIGQHTSLDPTGSGDPHGSATLLLNISVSGTSRAYALELPEIYSAYRLYVNGEPLAQMGDPSPEGYTPRTGNRAVMFTASDNIEIVLAMSDYSHIYSGLVYPPAFGEPEAVARLLSARLVLRAAVSATALLFGLFYLVLGLLLGRKGEVGGGIAILYGLLCLCFLGYSCYPVVKTVFSVGLWWYTLENLCYSAMLMLVMLIASKLCGYRGRAARAFPAFGGLICACVLFTPAIGRGGARLQLAWSALVGVYFIVCALYLTAVALHGLLRGVVGSRVMLCGALVFDAALVTDRLLPDFEPILTGWFTEWAGAVLVCCTGILIGQDILGKYRQYRALEENMDNMRRMMETQAAYYPLVRAQSDQIRAAHHDLRHHMAAIRGFAANGDNQGLAAYLNAYRPAAEPSSLVFCGHPVLNMLLSNFAAQAQARAVSFSARADVPDRLEYADPDLFAIVANLLENALEAVASLRPEKRFADLGIRRVPGGLAIAAENSFDGIIHQGDGGLLSRKRPGQPGVGTASVRRIAAKYGGSAVYRWEKTQRGFVFYAEVILLSGQEDHHAYHSNLRG